MSSFRFTKERVEQSMTKVEEYRGFNIVHVTERYRLYNRWKKMYHKNLYDGESDKYTFCKVGMNFNKEGNLYQCSQSTIDEAKKVLDGFLNGECYIFTNAEFQKEVKRHTNSHDYGYLPSTLKHFISRHKKGDLREKTIIEERLEDVNYHTLCGFVSGGDYDGALQAIKDEYTPNYRYSITVRRPGGEIKDDDFMRMEIKKAVEAYFKNHKGLKDIEVMGVE